MFQRKKRLDSRIRFQHQDFTKKLDQARHYKRSAQALPEEQSNNILHWLGLRTIYAQILTGLIIAGLIYLIFIPNFLAARTINVDGAGGDDANEIKSTVKNYINNAPFFKAQHNLIFLSKNQVEQALRLDPKIYKVSEVKKSVFSRSISVKVELKSTKYLLSEGDQFYAVYNDGSVKEPLNIDPTKWLETPGYIKIKYDGKVSISSVTELLSKQLVEAISQLNDKLKPESNTDVDYFVIPTRTISAPAPDTEVKTDGSAELNASPPVVAEVAPADTLPLDPINIYAFIKKQGSKQGSASDIKLIFDTRQELTPALQKLRLLLSQTASDRYNRLLYIDLRFKDRAFICLIGTACAQTN